MREKYGVYDYDSENDDEFIVGLFCDKEVAKIFCEENGFVRVESIPILDLH